MRILYRSIKLQMCHDYLPSVGRKEDVWETTAAEERQRNVHVCDGVSEYEFVLMRQARDAKLSAPTPLLPSIQVNMRARKLPPPDANGVHYIKVPISLPGP